MIRSLRLLGAWVALLFASSGLRAADDYQIGPDSKPQDGVPKGELIEFEFAASKIFPGTTRHVTIYVPKQYDGTKPACLYVNQDGVQTHAPVVFDNLIAKGEMPVTIGVFVPPGVVKAADSTTALDRYNRSYEYDGLGDAYVRFLLEEVLPVVETKTTSDGRAIKLSHDAKDRAIGGGSSGAIAAFTAAWERPEAFSRVFSARGTFVDIRGGGRYAPLIRKFEPRPIRVFLQDGSNDNNKYSGDWWMANQELERSLIFAGYEVNHAWGDGGHTPKQADAVFPDAMRFLWKGWPQPVQNGPTGNDTLKAILIPGENWQLVSEGHKGTDGPAVNPKGEVFFTEPSVSKGFKVGLDGAVSLFNPDCKKASGQAFGPDGRLFSVSGNDPKVIAYDASGAATVLVEGTRGNDLVVAHNGNIYITNSPPSTSNEPSKIWLLRPGSTQPVLVDSDLRFSNGIALSPDQTLLYIDDYRSHWVYSYSIQPDGTLANKQRFYWLHEPDNADDAGPDGMKVDREGRLYVTTRLGIQVCDQAGKVQCILPTPNRKASNLVFGGANFDTLYVTCGDKIYKRKLKATGANAWAEPNKPAKPQL